MKITNERWGEYTDSDKVQLDKVSSVSISKTLVQKIKNLTSQVGKKSLNYKYSKKPQRSQE